MGSTIAQAVSRRLPIADARIRVHVRSCAICDEQRGTGADFLRVLGFPMPILNPPIAPHSSLSIIRGWFSGLIVADIPSGLSLIPRQETKKKKYKNIRISGTTVKCESWMHNLWSHLPGDCKMSAFCVQ
jgi:hypothetical protein